MLFCTCGFVYDFSKIYWASLGFLGVSQGVVGGSWRSLGGPWASFRNPWASLVVTWVSFWRPWGSLGGPQEAPGGPRGGAKRDRTHKRFSRSVWGGLWGALGVILVVWGGP